MWAWGLLLSTCAEADWLLKADANRRSGYLRKGFSGRLLDAGCSSSSDKENIHKEIFESGKLHEVEAAVRVLLRMNIVTGELQRTAAKTGQLGDVSRYSHLWVIVGLFGWVVIPPLLFQRAELLKLVMLVAMPLQGLVVAHDFAFVSSWRWVVEEQRYRSVPQSELDRLDKIEPDVDEANAMLVESFLNVKRSLGAEAPSESQREPSRSSASRPAPLGSDA
ncbi:unnamed protein product, partial [Symbiodinium pilosum]